MNEYFEVKVHGEYFAQSGNKRELRGYDATFKLPSAKRALGVIKGKLLMPFLLKKDPQAVGVYTHYVDEILCHGRKLEPNEIPIRFQSKEQLREYIKYHQLGINVDDYGSVGLLRDHVRLAKEEPENFPSVKEAYAKKQAEEKALYELNADVLDNMVTHKPVAPSEGGQRINPPATSPAPETKEEPQPVKTKHKTKKKPVSIKPEPEVLSDEGLLE